MPKLACENVLSGQIELITTDCAAAANDASNSNGSDNSIELPKIMCPHGCRTFCSVGQTN